MYYSAKMSRQRKNGSSFVPKKILTCVLREAGGGLRATVEKKNNDLTITLSSQFF